MQRSTILRSNNRAAALALAALLLYPFAITRPIMFVEQMGHASEASILEGVRSLLASGELLVGLVVLACSIILPLGKLLAILVLASRRLNLRARHRALTYRAVEFTGRWGMLDVLLVTLLVAILKLGDMVDVSVGPAAWTFTTCVLLSLLASACFDPHSLWDSDS